MPKLINRAAVKRLALEFSTKYRSAKFTRVSAAFIEDVDESVYNAIYRMVAQHPSMGKTLLGKVSPVVPADPLPANA